MGTELLLVGVMYQVIKVCKNESEFDNFVNAVLGGQGWQWIFNHKTLVTSVTLPPRSIGPLNITDYLIEPLIYDAVITRSWTLNNLYFNGVSLSQPQFPFWKRSVRIAFFGDLVKKLAQQMGSVRYLGNPASGVSLTCVHEGGVGVVAISGVNDAWELIGDTCSNWTHRIDVFRSVLGCVNQSLGQSLSKVLGGVSLNTAKGWFNDMIGETGYSCLVGVLVADIKNSLGRTTRIVSVSANMCGKKGSYVAQTQRGQGSQIHMEIFLLERLGALLNHMSGPFEVVEVGILGLKTSKVVGENDMCMACQGTFDNELKKNKKIKKLDFGIVFLGP